MRTDYDVVVIGGGHNGLVAAAYLADAGQRVLVLESRDVLGGAAATEEVFPDFQVDTGASLIGLFSIAILSDLGLESSGLEFLDSPISALSLNQGEPLRLWRDPERARQEIEHHSPSDANRYFEFLDWVDNQASILREAQEIVPPATSIDRGLIPWAWLALKLRRRGRRAITDFLRTLPMSVEQLLDEWFENPLLKGTLASSGIDGSMQGPKASGTGLMLLYQSASGFPPAVRYVRGGTGELSSALAAVAIKRGAEIETGIRVEQVLLSEYRATGVRLSTGEEIRCEAIASSANPGHTLLDLVGAPHLELQVMRRTRNIRYQGSTAKLNIALKAIPEFPGVNDVSELTGRILISPSTDYLEHAYDDAKYRSWSRSPFVEMSIPTLVDSSRAPDGMHILSAVVRYAPYHLDGQDWGNQREAFGDHIVATIEEYAPNLPRLVKHRQILTPLDYEREYGLREGSIHHGQMALDQLLTMRPLPGYGQYRSPVDGLYFCGAGAHPGGGVTGVPGRNAARVISRDLERS